MSFTPQHMFFDDVEVGQTWESGGRTITETDIVNFAGLSGDFNPIHMDEAFASSTIFKQRIAHGLLVLSIGSGLIVSIPLMRTIAFAQIKEWHFTRPVYIGDTIRARSTVLEKEERARGRRGQIIWKREIINQEEKVVQEGVTITLVEGRASIRSSPGSQAESSASG